MITSKKIRVNKNDETTCNSLLITAYTNGFGDKGVLFVAWHDYQGEIILQSDFIEMDLKHVCSFIRDYSNISAEDYVARFKPESF